MTADAVAFTGVPRPLAAMTEAQFDELDTVDVRHGKIGGQVHYGVPVSRTCHAAVHFR
ncbi:hypothetical protein [Rhizobium grahamii]|uniref:hypothetical protein n=1 Tax=Rhizobium grahamii TaxID=1120045 RepID=UPI00159EDB08|nr:hypothetical protein [Rhizobium grahamii]